MPVGRKEACNMTKFWGWEYINATVTRLEHREEGEERRGKGREGEGKEGGRGVGEERKRKRVSWACITDC